MPKANCAGRFAACPSRSRTGTTIRSSCRRHLSRRRLHESGLPSALYRHVQPPWHYDRRSGAEQRWTAHANGSEPTNLHTASLPKLSLRHRSPQGLPGGAVSARTGKRMNCFSMSRMDRSRLGQPCGPSIAEFGMSESGPKPEWRPFVLAPHASEWRIDLVGDVPALRRDPTQFHAASERAVASTDGVDEHGSVCCTRLRPLEHDTSDMLQRSLAMERWVGLGVAEENRRHGTDFFSYVENMTGIQVRGIEDVSAPRIIVIPQQEFDVVQQF
jgi:hypothetical protein